MWRCHGCGRRFCWPGVAAGAVGLWRYCSRECMEEYLQPLVDLAFEMLSYRDDDPQRQRSLDGSDLSGGVD